MASRPKAFADLTGQRAVVTGASSGIGRAIALELANGGADLLLHCRESLNPAEELAESIRELGRSAQVLQADFSQEAQLPQFVDQCWGELGQVDIWVNNAGVDLLTGAGASLSFAEKLDRLWQVDVRSTVLFCRLVGRRMKEEGKGVLLNIGWDQADRGMEGDSGELFATAKNSVMGFTRSIAVSMAPEVRVNCIAPGWIQTAWGEQVGPVWQQRVIAETPLKRWGKPEDIAKLARFLVSTEADYLTGQVINANGGAVR